MTDQITLDTMVCAMAAATRGPALTGGATPLSQLAVWLAATKDPSLWALSSEGAVIRPGGQESPRLRLLDTQSTAYAEKNLLTRLSLVDVFRYVSSGRFRIWIAAAQVDETGAANISCIGPWHRPKVALVGTRGLADDAVNIPMLYYVTGHSRRSLVPRVDFRSASGYAQSGSERGHPDVLVTNLGVFRHSGVNGWEAQSLHAGVDPGTVHECSGFPIRIDEDVPTTPLPTTQEMDLIRRFDPDGVRYLEDGQNQSARSAALARESRPPL